jgi:hypothetical protein
MRQLFRFQNPLKRDPTVNDWMLRHEGPLGTIAQRWFEVIHHCGDDVRELLHDGHPTACVGEAAFAYVNAFKSHVNIGFFQGAELDDPNNLLEGDGKFMRHVKLMPESQVDSSALTALIQVAYADVKSRLQAGASGAA